MILQVTNKPIIHKSAEAFSALDPYGIAMTIIAMFIVFASLIFLYIIFKYVSKIYSLDLKKGRGLTKKLEKSNEIKQEDTSGEVVIAIASAIYFFHNQIHDIEDTVLTIKKITKTYSPWSSKIYGLRKAPK